MALKILVLAFAFFAAALAAPESRVVGGTPTTIREFPYISAFVYYYPRPSLTVQRCVGSIISSWHILTTAFCFTGAELENMYIRAGSTDSLEGGVTTYIREVIKHPLYNEEPRTGDIAVVVVTEPLRVSDTINILFIPPQNTYIPDGTEMKVVSWGFDAEDGEQNRNLKTLNLDKVPLDSCQAAYADEDGLVIIDDPVICASREGNYGICLGDSGAPMVIGQVIVGLSSFFKECGNAEYPDVFTRIDRYTDWILSVAVAPASASRDVSHPTVRVAQF